MEQNRLMEETERQIAGLCLYPKELNEQKEDEERGSTLADFFDAAMNRALRDGKHSDAIDFADSAAFLRENGIEYVQELRDSFRNEEPVQVCYGADETGGGQAA